MRHHNRTWLLVLVLLILVPTFVWAGGRSEQTGSTETEMHDEDHHDEDHHDEDGHDHDDNEHHDDHDDDDDHDDHGHEGEMAIPHIEPADLASGESLLVVASTSIVGDVVKQIAGSAATVEVLMPVGQNPHAYEPTPRAIASVEDSYITFVNGLNLEENLLETIETVAGTYVVPVSAGLTIREGGEHHHGDEHHDEHGEDHHEEGEHHDDHDDEDHHEEGEDHDHDDEHGEDEHHHDHSAGDPHFWFDPNNVIVWAENVAEALREADPANSAVYEANRDAYIAELEALDLEVRSMVASIPRSERKLVTGHDALGYYADAYGFEIIGEVIPSVSDQAEPSARDIAELAEVIEEEGISAIAIGGTAGRGLQNLVRAVADEVGGDIQIVEMLTGSLAQAGSRGDTYLDFVRFNTEQIVAGLSR